LTGAPFGPSSGGVAAPAYPLLPLSRECLTSLACHRITMPSADCPDTLGLPCGGLTSLARGASGLSRGYPCCFRYV